MAAVAAAAAGVMFYHLFNLPNERGTEVQLLIEKGAGSRRVAEQLAEAGVISHPLLFRLAARVSGLDKDLKAGEYVFLPGISMREVLAIISRGEVHYRRLTLPEGLTTARMLELIRAEPNLAGEITIAAEEGELLPETYSYVKGDSRDSIVRRARLAMEKTLEEAWRQNRRKVLKNRRQLLTLASIIEKETGVPEERADVAAVFINRLETGMKLQTDPTVIYALTKGKKRPRPAALPQGFKRRKPLQYLQILRTAAGTDLQSRPGSDFCRRSSERCRLSLFCRLGYGRTSFCPQSERA